MTIVFALGFAAGGAAIWFGKDKAISAYQAAAAFVAKVKGWL